MINWGIIGLGNIAGRFAESLKHLPNAKLFAVSSRSQDKADDFAKKFSAVKGYAGHEKLLADENIQAVYIALPHAMHKNFSIQALKSGKAVLCEKPATLNLAEMQEIAKVSRAEKVLFMEAMKPRFQPAYKKLKNILAEKNLGKILSVETSLCNEMTLTGKTYHSEKNQGGALLDVGIYCASWLDDFLGEVTNANKVTAEIKNGIDFYVDAELNFSGRVGKLECAFDRKKPRQAILNFERGKIIVDELHRPQEFTIYAENNQPQKISAVYEVDDFFGEIKHFTNLIERGKIESEVMSLQASLNCAKILQEVRKNFCEVKL